MADDALVHAAERIADGENVDWASLSPSLDSDAERSVADELEVLGHIAAGHRQLHELLPVNADHLPALHPTGHDGVISIC